MCFWKCFSVKFQTDKANKRPDRGSSLAKIQPAILTMLDNYKLMSLTNFESNWLTNLQNLQLFKPVKLPILPDLSR